MKNNTSRDSSEDSFTYTIPEPASEIPASPVVPRDPPEQKIESQPDILTGVNSGQKTSTQYSGWGYRIQIYSTLQQDEAEAEAQRAREKNPEDKVYIEFDPPYYKVRVGNCSNSDEAEEVLARLKRMGYSNAWIVRARVIENDE